MVFVLHMEMIVRGQIDPTRCYEAVSTSLHFTTIAYPDPCTESLLFGIFGKVSVA